MGRIKQPPKEKRQKLPSGSVVRRAIEECIRQLATCQFKLKTADPVEASIDVIDLFSGCGGFSSGFRVFSQFLPVYRLAGAVDLERDANRAYAANLNVVPFHGDAHAVATDPKLWRDFENSLNRKKGNLTVVVGGPPCQGFTSHKQSIEGHEGLNELFPDFARIATRLGADVIIMENVPELLTNRSWPFYTSAVDVLRKNGYVVRTRVHNLAGFGVPQERFRCLTIAMRHPFGMPEPFLLRDDYRTVREAIGHLPAISPGQVDPLDPDHVTAGHKPSTVATIAAVAKDGGRRPAHIGPECLRRLAMRSGRSGFDDVYGRLWWDRASVTITGSSRNPASGRFSHPEQDRGLSVREGAQLQGFPINFKFSGSFDSRFLQVGNAVPPIFAAFLAGHIALQLSEPMDVSVATDRDIVAPVGSSFSRLIAGIKQGAITI